MDLLSLAASCSLFVTAHCETPAPTKNALEQWRPTVHDAASQFAVPEAWVMAVMHAESGGQLTLSGRPITSKAGAMGLMQLMPDTYSDLQRQYGLGGNAYAPHDNIIAGAAYLRQMYTRYGYPGLFAAYNAGPGRFDAYLARQKPLPDETLRYLATIAPGAETRFSSASFAVVKASKSTRRDGIFVTQGRSAALFVTLSTSRP